MSTQNCAQQELIFRGLAKQGKGGDGLEAWAGHGWIGGMKAFYDEGWSDDPAKNPLSDFQM